MKTSIIIPTYSNHVGLVACLESVAKYTDLFDVEIVIVANGAPPETRNIKHLGIPLTMLWFDEPLGFSKACNAGIRESSGEFIVLLNDDCTLLPQEKNHWLSLLAGPFDDPQVGITGSHKLWNPDTQHEFIIFFCAMLRRTVVEQLGGLDESLSPFYGEDITMCIEAERAGWKCIAVGGEQTLVPIPGSERLPEWKRARWSNSFPIMHSGEETLGQLPNHVEVVERNRAKLRAKYGVNIERAKQIEGWMSESELTWLATQAKSRRIVVELGSHCGRSTRAFADNLPEGGTVFAVDTWEDTEVYQKFQNNLSDHIRGGRVIPLQIDGSVAARMLGVKADLIFIDALHDYDSVKADIQNWQSLLAEDGLFCGHDYHTDWPGVIQAVDELLIARQPTNTGIWEALDKPNITESVEGYGGFFCTEKQTNSLSA